MSVLLLVCVTQRNAESEGWATQATEGSRGNLPFGGVGLSRPVWWDAEFMRYQFLDHPSLGYRERISLETLMGATCVFLEFLYWLKCRPTV